MNSFPIPSFDVAHPDNVGRPKFFDVGTYLSVVNQMVSCDEVSRALWMLNNMPGYYRDKVPKEAVELKNQILTKLFTTKDYASYSLHNDQTHSLIQATAEEIDKKMLSFLSRGIVAKALVKELNDKGIRPHINEIAPGSFWLPIGLKKNGLKFTYRGIGLNQAHDDLAKNYLGGFWREEPGGCNIFICYELIEHLHSEEEIFQYFLKDNINYDHILLSTPKYTVGGGNLNWMASDLGHLRTYTPSEFIRFAIRTWQDFKWVMYDDQVMVLKGERE